jgi:hypothetical protein
MTHRAFIKRFARGDDGTTVVELAIVLPIFLLIFFMIIDFGRMAFHYVTAEKAVQVAARVAAVRPAACPGVPNFNVRGATASGDTPLRTGTLCSAGANVCLNPGTVTCTGDLTNPTAVEVWNIVNGALPNDAEISNLEFSYTHDPMLGFLGGPYVPIMTVQLTDLNFRFVNPLGAFVALAGGPQNSTAGATVSFPSMSVSLPAEDLAQGDAG